MSSSRTTLRRGISDLQGDFIRDPDGSVPTTSSAGGALGITAIDSNLSYFDDGYFNDWYFVLPTGPTDSSGSYEVTRVADFSQSTGVLTLEPDASAVVASGQTYELHRYSPSTKHLALNAARSIALDALWLSVVDETIVIDNLVDNWDFETLADGLFTGWTKKGVLTLTQNASYFIHGSSSANMAGVASTGIEQDLLTKAGGFSHINRGTQKTLHVRAWLRSTDASNGRIRVSFNGTTFTNGSYHGGNNGWEGPDIHYIDVPIPSDLTEIMLSVEKSTSSDVQADVVVAWIDQINQYTLPTSIHRRPAWVKQNADRFGIGITADWKPISKNNMPQSGRILRLEGKGLLTEVTTETSTMEVSDPETQLLYAEALDWLIDHEIGNSSTEAQALLERDKSRWQVAAARIRARGGQSRSISPQMPDGTWGIVTDGETEYLQLRNR